MSVAELAKPTQVHNSARELAINGGPRAVTASGRDRWKHVRWGDVVPILLNLARGKTRDPSGKMSAAFEKRFAKLTGSQYALLMNSGTATLHSALFAVGVGPGDEVILPSYTYHATASAILCCGAAPVFCDIDPQTLTADPDDISRRITHRTKAIMPVHVWGNPAHMDRICEIAVRHDLAVVEDCSHTHGACFEGKPVGSWGAIGCFSLQGSKPVSAGEGGVAVCDDPELYDRMLALGQPSRTTNGLKTNDFRIGSMNLGPKYRPHLLAAQLASSSLKRLAQLNALRSRNWQILTDEFAGVNGLRVPDTLPGASRGGFFEFKVVLEEGIDLPTFLEAARAEGVPVRQDRYGFLHDEPLFRSSGPLTYETLTQQVAHDLDVPHLPNTEAMRGRILTLPAFTRVSEHYVRQCSEGLKKVARCVS